MQKILSLSTILLTLSTSTALANNKTICGTTDDRVLSQDSKVARASRANKEYGCTVTMIGRSCAISAGHCVGALEKASFNVPLSINTEAQPSKPEDTYYRTKDFLRYKDQGAGNDWAVIRLMPNKITGQYPGDVQGYYQVDLKGVARVGDIVRITGHGVDREDDIRNFAQQSHSGEIAKLGTFWNKSKLGYSVDTTGGNSGSSVILERNQKIIGVHSHGTCTESGGHNEGTLIAKNKIFKEVIQECLNWENSL
ncbi:serine protease [Bacteriovorax sp. DB6_IX]|uniref:trypsin-like serine peptidase n=1 Tax=Bacteriovorax sp. DB6_IX TaxID=1353530 RepID=UPI00038A3256|nr:trypsin-like serine protease [Bacteriovorax sp. DB6_IX]EQC52075.1 trypsin [Bacteriovorax sp. DB6_IX]